MVLRSNMRTQNSHSRAFDYLHTGQISDEVQETYNKYIQRFLKDFAQKVVVLKTQKTFLKDVS